MLMAPPGGLRVNYKHSYRKVTSQKVTLSRAGYRLRTYRSSNFPQNSIHEIASSHITDGKTETQKVEVTCLTDCFAVSTNIIMLHT